MDLDGLMDGVDIVVTIGVVDQLAVLVPFDNREGATTDTTVYCVWSTLGDIDDVLLVLVF